MGLDVPARPKCTFPIVKRSTTGWSRAVIISTDNPIGIATVGPRAYLAGRSGISPSRKSRRSTTSSITTCQNRRLQVALLGAFAALALALACVGLYGVLAFLVSQRTQEVGVRIALGAQPSDILTAVVGRGVALAAAGIAIGLIAAVALTRLLERLLFGISARDVFTFVGPVVSMILLLVSTAACLIPARRAMGIDPIIALRYE